MQKNMLITGGAGFIGCNAAAYFLKKRWRVTIFDNFSRPGSRTNADWLGKQRSDSLRVVTGDIRSSTETLNEEARSADVVLHLAGQVAVTTSVIDPVEDAQLNVIGTLHVLEAARASRKRPIVIYSSTNKVYGGLEHVVTREEKTRYSFVDAPFGISESCPLDFHSPYGCSKGAADQYVRDYYRIYGLPTIVLRQSCIYGPHQHGMEDQGWVAWFMIALCRGHELTIYGSGKQVRDLLYIDDLMGAYDLAIANIQKTKGQIYNIGGGRDNTLSVWHEFAPLLEKLFGRRPRARFAKARPGDQAIYISDIRKAFREFGWKPRVPLAKGLPLLARWIQANVEHVHHSVS